jgi:hypothetical protein
MAVAAAGPASPGPRPVQRAAARAAASATDRNSYKKNSAVGGLAGAIRATLVSEQQCQSSHIIGRLGKARRSYCYSDGPCRKPWFSGWINRRCWTGRPGRRQTPLSIRRRRQRHWKNSSRCAFRRDHRGVEQNDFLTFKFVGPALGTAGLCLLSSVGRRPKKPIQPIEQNDCLLLARLM